MTKNRLAKNQLVKSPIKIVLLALLAATATFSSALAAPATDIKWRETSLPPSAVISVKELANSNSNGKKTWNVKGDCSINKAKTQVTTKPSGSCIVTLKIAKKGSFKAIAATKALSIGGSGATNTSATTGTTVTTIATVATTSNSPIYYTPAPMSVILKRSLPGKTLSALSAVSNRTKFMIGDNSSGALAANYLTIDSASSYAAPAAPLTAQIFESYLKGIFNAAPDTTDTSQFRIDSVLHNIYSLDFESASSNKLVFKINWGFTTASTGFISFSYDNSTKLLQAKKRYSLSTSMYTHSLDSSFSAANYYVKLSNGSFSLVPSIGDATQLHLFSSPINYDMPTDFNPDGIAFVSNERVSLAGVKNESTSSYESSNGVLRDITATYKPQISVVGSSSATKSAADAKIAEIKTLVEAQGGKLRYDTLLYKNYRDGALGVTLQSSSIANGTLGQQTTPFVYFTNEKDSSGMYHPFMVMASYSITDKPSNLNDIRRPPGDGTSGGGYASSKVTRDAVLQLAMNRIPLRDYGLVSSLTENTFVKSLLSDGKSSAAPNTFNYASTSTNGIAFDGVEIYPAMNNTVNQSQPAAEICSIGVHVGQGMGLHYHADGFSALNNGLSLYNSDDYTGKTHPPLLGFGLDGVALFGKYLAANGSMIGYSVALDEYGGHDHDGIGYHYHAHTEAAVSPLGKAYTLHLLLRGAWRGKINSIPSFWVNDKKSTYLGF